MVEADNPGNISNAAIAGGELKSTYRGRYWQQTFWIYTPQHKLEWDPRDNDRKVTARRLKNGLSATKDKIYGTGELAEKGVGYDVKFDVRKEYWDANIEPKNETGISELLQETKDNKSEPWGTTSDEHDVGGIMTALSEAWADWME